MSSLRLKDIASTLLANGYNVLPIEPGTKSPNIPGWSKIKADQATIDQWLREGRGNWGVGILAAETPGIDLDISNEDMLSKVERWCEQNIGVANTRIGRAPRKLFVCRSDAPFGKMVSTAYLDEAGNKQQIEILGAGQQFVAYATHPDTGKPYTWSGDDPTIMHADLLPVLTPDKARELIAYFEANVPSTWRPTGRAKLDATIEREGNPNKRTSLLNIRSALAAIPNTEDTQYDDWIRVCYSIWSAVGEDKSAGYELFDEWSAKNETLYDPANTLRVWDAEKKVVSLGAGTLFHLAGEHGWKRPIVEATAEFDAVGIDVGWHDAATGKAHYGERPEVADNDEGDKPIAFAFSVFKPRDPKTIPPRQWLYDRHLIAGFVSTTVSPGGLGKSALSISECLAMATGKSLLGAKPPRPLRVAYWNGEDPLDEIERRVAAAMIHFALTESDLNGRFFMDSGRALPIKLAVGSGGDLQIAKPAVERLVNAIRARQLDVLVIDPFVTTHSVAENDNTAMNAVAGMWREVADRAGCAVDLVHHATKQARLPGQSDLLGAAQARGAGALLDAVRAERHLVGMSEEEAGKLGVPERRSFFRVESGKANLAPPAEHARWRRLVSVPLGNGSGFYPHGDEIGVVTQWEIPDALEDLTNEHLLLTIEKIAAGDWKQNEQSDVWAGFAIAEVINLDIGSAKKAGRTHAQNAARATVRSILTEWIGEEYLLVRHKQDPRNRKPAPFIEVGKRAPDLGART